MPLFFFDLHGPNGLERDDFGVEFDTEEQVRLEAMRLLPAVALEEVRHDGDQQAYTVLVTNEGGLPIYSATLNYAGLWLRR